VADYEGEILAGAAALLAVLLSLRGVKIRVEHAFKRDRNEEDS
jgi:hypothetical protein